MEIKNQNRFMAHATGLCCDCGQHDTLDSMIRKDNQIGMYHCKDCEVKSITELQVWDIDYKNKPIVLKKYSMTNKLFKFLFEGI